MPREKGGVSLCIGRSEVFDLERQKGGGMGTSSCWQRYVAGAMNVGEKGGEQREESGLMETASVKKGACLQQRWRESGRVTTRATAEDEKTRHPGT